MNCYGFYKQAKESISNLTFDPSEVPWTFEIQKFLYIHALSVYEKHLYKKQGFSMLRNAFLIPKLWFIEKMKKMLKTWERNLWILCLTHKKCTVSYKLILPVHPFYDQNKWYLWAPSSPLQSPKISIFHEISTSKHAERGLTTSEASCLASKAAEDSIYSWRSLGMLASREASDIARPLSSLPNSFEDWHVHALS